MFKKIILQINQIGLLPEDEGLRKNQKNFLVYEAILMSMGGLLWGVICIYLEKYVQSVIPFGYILLSFINILIFHYYKLFKFTQGFQTAISLFLPFIFQWTLGGFMASGAVMVWAILSLAASLSYSNVKTSFFWMLTFVLLTIFSGIFYAYFHNLFPAEYTTNTAIVLFTMNISVVSVLIFFLIIFYVSENQNSYFKVKDAQDMVVESEKMAALGQLSAGIAHEINTPLGSIKALTNETSLSLEQIPRNLFVVFNRLDENQKKALLDLITHHHIRKDFLTTREERVIRKQLTEELTTHQIPQAAEIASQLIQIDMLQLNDSLLTLKGPFFKDCVLLLCRFFIVQKNNKTILFSVEKASRIVKALKMYIHNAENNKPETYHLKESISTILTIYQNQLKSGIEVILDIPETIYLTGYEEEVSQVWTNLIVNACQAMDFKGELKISAKENSEDVTILFTDTGCGIPAGSTDKIFEPFYSTKKIGEGSGLGLSIVKKIIDKHQGKISFVSELNKGTTFYVNLPKLVKEETT